MWVYGLASEFVIGCEMRGREPGVHDIQGFSLAGVRIYGWP